MKRASTGFFLCLLLLCPAALAADKAKDGGKREQKAPTTRRAARTHTIRIRSSKFSPAALTIRVGEKVVWENDDDKDHTVIADDKSFKSDNIGPDDTFEHTFRKAGAFKYACKYHPREKATITVEK